MKRVIVVSKTHLDLGFTDFAENIRKRYLDEFIPDAIATAESANIGRKNFIWTTGSWLLREELRCGTPENREKLIAALKAGDIAPHAFPFTTHTELLDRDTLEYGLSIVDEIDSIRGKKTVAANMTDVPGHTKALVPLLAEKGIKLLHIGVNGASAMPEVPECFLWKCEGSEIVVVYSGEYGGAYKNEYLDDILYFDHTLDNHGANGKEAVMQNIADIKAKYPGYEVSAGTLDDYAEEIWEVRDRLPVITSEIGDSWIHGSAADPYKSAALRTLIRLKNKWLADGSLKRDSEEYACLADNILCLAEHTCGMDVKIALGEYENYLRPDFERAKSINPAYTKIEKTWAEQRLYIKKATEKLSAEHMKGAKAQLDKLIPKEPFGRFEESGEADKEYQLGESRISFNSFGGVKSLTVGGREIIAENDSPCITYDSYGADDYNYWFTHYSRDLDKTAHWAFADFGKPNIDKIADKYKQGRFAYKLENLTVSQEYNRFSALAELHIDGYFYESLGAPQVFQIKYTLESNRLTAELLWQSKPANRLPESIMFHVYPRSEKVSFTKLGRKIDPFDIVRNGNRNIAAVENIELDGVKITNLHSPLVGIGKGKILHFDNEYSPLSDGIAYVLYDNIWGTNFPLWYSDNAYFKYDIEF